MKIATLKGPKSGTRPTAGLIVKNPAGPGQGHVHLRLGQGVLIEDEQAGWIDAVKGDYDVSVRAAKKADVEAAGDEPVAPAENSERS